MPRRIYQIDLSAFADNKIISPNSFCEYINLLPFKSIRLDLNNLTIHSTNKQALTLFWETVKQTTIQICSTIGIYSKPHIQQQIETLFNQPIKTKN